MIKFRFLLSLVITLSIGSKGNAQQSTPSVNKTLTNQPKLQPQVSQTTVHLPVNDEQEEFRILMQESAKMHDKKTVKLLNNIFNSNSKKESESILLVRNDSSCNIILRLQGKEHYNLAVPSKGENFISLIKDSYVIKGKVCNSEYYKTKDLTSNQIITLKYTVQN